MTTKATLWEQRELDNVGKRSIRRKLGSSCCKTVLIGFSVKGILH